MTKAEYMEILHEQYAPVKTLSKKNGGEVLLVRHKELSRDMVVRIYAEKIDAYRILKSFIAENLPRVYECIEGDDCHIVLEEYIDGITVSEVLESGCYTYGGAKAVLKQLCRAVGSLHALGIVHRDIKPENVIISKDGGVYLIDLNASRRYAEEKERDTRALGTVGYASPEQFGVAQSDARSDVYSLGILLNVMLTKSHPSASLAKGKAGRIVLRCTAVDPNKRFKTVRHLASAL